MSMMSISTVRNTQSLLAQAMMLMKQDQYTKALPFLKNIQKQDPTHAEVQQLLGIVLAKLSMPKQALHHCNQAIHYAPNRKDYYLNRAKIYKLLGQEENVVPDLEHALTLDPQYYAAHIALGDWHYDNNAYEAARTHYEAGLQLRDQDPNIWCKLGASYMGLKNYPKAKSALNIALRIHPEHAKALAYLGNVLRFMHKNDEAILLYEKAFTLDPSLKSAHIYARATS